MTSLLMNTQPVRFMILALTISFSLQGCMQSSAIPDAQRPINWGTALNKHYNFYQVSPWLYRSEQPTSQLLPLLEQQQIDIIINLRVQNDDQQLLKHSNIKLIHIPMNAWDIRQQEIVQVMQILQTAQVENKKVLIHCYHGSDRTGAMVGMSRILLENWSVTDAMNEMKHGGYGFHPIWVNIDRLFSSKHIEWMRQQLAHPQKTS